MTFIPSNMPQSGSKWGLPGLGSYNALDQLSPASLSFSQGSLMSPGIDLTPVDMTDINKNIGAAAQSYGIGGGVGQGMNGLQIASLALGGLNTLGGLYAAFQANKLAKKQFKFTRDFSLANLRNSTQEFNTRLEDRARARAFTEGRDSASADAYIQQHRLATDLGKFGK